MTDNNLKITELTVKLVILNELNINLQNLLACADARIVLLENAIDEYLIWGNLNDLIQVRPEPSHTPANLELSNEEA